MAGFGRVAQEKIDIFSVKKKSGKLRLVADCMRSNCWFTAPAGVRLATGDTLAGLELSDDEALTVGSADRAGASYHLELPPPLRPYFSLRRVRAGAVGITEVEGRAVSPQA